MIKRGLIFAFLFCILVRSVWALTFPQPQGFVNDFAHVLNQETKDTLESKLSNFEKETSHEITVVTIPDLQGDTIEDYSVHLFEQWKIGKKKLDNGVLLLVAVNDRKVRIEVGYGLEGVLTDIQSGKIIRTLITPQFKKGDYNQGITDGVDAIMQITQGEKVDFPREDTTTNKDDGWIGGVFFLVILFAQYVVAFLARSKSWWLGGVMGVVLAVILEIAFALPLIGGFGLGIILGALGLLLDYILSKNYQQRAKNGLSNSWTRSYGGFWSGSGSSSSGSSFGGFGGGGSGGGGASGSW